MSGYGKSPMKPPRGGKKPDKPMHKMPGGEMMDGAKHPAPPKKKKR